MFVPQYPHPVIGGLERQAQAQAVALRRLGVDVRVLSGRFAPAQQASETIESVPVIRIPWPSRRLRFLVTPFHLARVLWRDRQKCGLVHLHQYSAAALFVLAFSKLLGKRVLVKLSSVEAGGLPGLRRLWLGRFRQWLLLRADAIVVLSEASAAEVLSAGYPSARISRIPNGVTMPTGVMRMQGGTHAAVIPAGMPGSRPGMASLQPTPTSSGLDSTRSSSHWLERRRTLAGTDRHAQTGCLVVYAGRLSAEKGVSVLLHAWARVCEASDHAARLQIWGEGPMRGALVAECAALGLTGRVDFLGHLDDVRERLSDADILVLPSWVEGNSNAVLEAMWAGLPIVATAVGGTPMLVGESGRPFLCTAGAARALSQALLRLIRDQSLRRQLGQAMAERARRSFSIEDVARRYQRLYLELCSGRPLTQTDWLDANASDQEVERSAIIALG